MGGRDLEIPMSFFPHCSGPGQATRRKRVCGAFGQFPPPEGIFPTTGAGPRNLHKIHEVQQIRFSFFINFVSSVG